MGRIVIACYRPKPGKNEDLKALMRDHLSVLRDQGLVTDRDSIMMEAECGTIIEVFEWHSLAAIEGAHENPAVLKMWQAYEEVCDYVPVAEVPEAKELFSGFKPFA